MMERVAEKVINMIEEQAHTSGLTDRERNMILELLGKEIQEEEEEVEEVPEPDEDQL
jgi:exosome complex component RRP4